MKLTDNNALNVLIVVNVFALLAIFTLLWILWKNGMSVPAEQVIAEQVVVNGSAVVSQQGNVTDNVNKDNVETAPAKKLTMAEKISMEVASTDALLKERIDKQSASTKNLAEVKSLDELSDIEYVVQYQKTKNDVPAKRNISDEDVTTVKVVKDTGQSNEKNKFNNVDVSGLKNRAEIFDTITTRIAALMLDEKKSVSADTNGVNSDDAGSDDNNLVKPEAWDNYLDAIKSAGVERKNEMRSIRVKEGESLWKIAVRAYGNGFLYTKIFEANPQLTDPNLIVAGEMLRVPL